MRLSTIVLALRMGNTRFGSRVGGLVEFAAVEGNTLKKEVAFVIPYDEEADGQQNDSGINQKIKERFSVVVVAKNDTNLNDKTGLVAYDTMHDVRNELFKILINFDIGYETTIEYDRGRLLEFNAAWIWYRYDFTVWTRLSADESGYGFVEERTIDSRMQPSQLPDFNAIYADYILAPSADLPYTGKLPASNYIDVDASQQTDSGDNPNLGAYDSGFAKAYKKLLS